MLSTLHDHLEMIDLNPLVEERHPIKAPPNASAEEYHCQWYALTDRVQYLPGGLASGKVSYNVCFHDLGMGLQTHCYAPMGLNIKGKWTLGGSLPGEPIAPVELGVGAPMQGLWIREDVDMKCNIMMTSFVKKTLKKAHSKLVDRLVVKAQIVGAAQKNEQLSNPILGHQVASGSRASTHYTQSLSDFDNETLHENETPAYTPPFNPYPHPPPPQHEHPAFSNTADDLSLYPKALSTRSSSASWKDGSQNGRSSYQNSMTGGKNAGARVSWQNLNAGGARSPSMQQIDLAYQKASAYHRDSSVSRVSSEGYPQSRRESGRSDSKSMLRETAYSAAPPPPPPKPFAPAELE